VLTEAGEVLALRSRTCGGEKAGWSSCASGSSKAGTERCEGMVLRCSVTDITGADRTRRMRCCREAARHSSSGICSEGVVATAAMLESARGN